MLGWRLIWEHHQGITFKLLVAEASPSISRESSDRIWDLVVSFDGRKWKPVLRAGLAICPYSWLRVKITLKNEIQFCDQQWLWEAELGPNHGIWSQTGLSPNLSAHPMAVGFCHLNFPGPSRLQPRDGHSRTSWGYFEDQRRCVYKAPHMNSRHEAGTQQIAPRFYTDPVVPQGPLQCCNETELCQPNLRIPS